MDELRLPELTRRQETILAFVVRSYTESLKPVSSQQIAEQTNLQVSSATIRNELVDLENLGYITQPHTSAGRVPTENGYRYFVKHLINNGDLSRTDQSRISARLEASPLASEGWMRTAATALARTAGSAALVTQPIAETSRFKHLELIAIQGRLVLMVLVLQGGTVAQEYLNLAEVVPQPRLSEVAGRINAACPDLTANDVRMKGTALGLLEREISEIVADRMERSDSSQVRVYRDGLSEIVPSFPTAEGQQQVIRAMEERAFIHMILNDILTPEMGPVQVIIAGEGRWEAVNHLTMVLSRYGIAGQVSGAIGVLGPTHINYGRAISSVRYVAGKMTDMLQTLYETPTPAEEPPPPASKPDKPTSG
jgi:heat-inducible transcriptional repressor